MREKERHTDTGRKRERYRKGFEKYIRVPRGRYRERERDKEIDTKSERDHKV